MKAVVAAFNQEKALVGAFSVIVQPVVKPMDRFAALVLTEHFDHLVLGHWASAQWTPVVIITIDYLAGLENDF